MEQKKRKEFGVKPTYFAACKELAGNATSGGVLFDIQNLSKENTLEDENGEKGWLAMTMPQIQHLTGCTRSQYSEAMKRLVQKGLIDKRHRKMSRRHKYTKIWVRITEKTKAGISEITNRAPMYDFPESTDAANTEKSENKNSAVVEKSETLAENINLENEIDNNVVITKNNNNKAYNSSSKETLEKSSSYKEGEYKKIMEEVYKNAPEYAIDPYSLKKSERLQEIISYLNSVQHIYSKTLAEDTNHSIAAMRVVVSNWKYFREFTVTLKKGFNDPDSPLIFYLYVQRSSIPDFCRFMDFINKYANAKKQEINDPDYYFDDFQDYLILSKADKEKYWENAQPQVSNDDFWSDWPD